MQTLPYHRINTLTGLKGAEVLKDAVQGANIIKTARRPLIVTGHQIMISDGLPEPLGSYAIKIAESRDIPICASADSKKYLVALEWEPESTLDFIDVVNHLKNKPWKGVLGQGFHDLVIFMGIRSDLLEQGLSTLKHFAPHLKTMTLDNEILPHANYSLPNWRKGKQWQTFLDGLVEALTGQEKTK
jgi:anaerobic carbon-monoxide dehydrogenase, CODH/ACS complex subunit epsilon